MGFIPCQIKIGRHMMVDISNCTSGMCSPGPLLFFKTNPNKTLTPTHQLNKVVRKRKILQYFGEFWFNT